MTTQEAKNAVNRRFKQVGNQSFFACIKEVDSTLRTCTVTVDEVIYEDVILYATIKKELKGFVFIPKIGSQVMVSRIGGSNELFVLMFSEIDNVLLTIDDKVELLINAEKLHYKNDKTELRITNKGFTIKKDSSGLLKTLTDLCDAIKKAFTQVMADEGDRDAALDKVADALADAVVKAIKSMTITYSAGLVAPAMGGPVTGTFNFTIT